MRPPVITVGFLMCSIAIGLGSEQRSDAHSTPPVRPTPVVVELFTSEGCSDCPPADDLLRKLERTQPVAGVEIIGLEEHVDYWDHLGWKDPFSSAGVTSRQNNYAGLFHQDSVYTPQMVVDGLAQFVGSDADQAEAQITRAATLPQASVVVSDSGNNHVSVVVTSIPSYAAGSLRLLLAITEEGLKSDVKRGENQGAILAHGSVVRSLTDLGPIDSRGKGEIVKSAGLYIAPNWNRARLRVVVFLQNAQTGAILGAGETRA